VLSGVTVMCDSEECVLSGVTVMCNSEECVLSGVTVMCDSEECVLSGVTMMSVCCVVRCNNEECVVRCNSEECVLSGVCQDDQRSCAQEHLCDARQHVRTSWHWYMWREWTADDQVHLHGEVEEIDSMVLLGGLTDVTAWCQWVGRLT